MKSSSDLEIVMVGDDHPTLPSPHRLRAQIASALGAGNVSAETVEHFGATLFLVGWVVFVGPQTYTIDGEAFTIARGFATAYSFTSKPEGRDVKLKGKPEAIAILIAPNEVAVAAHVDAPSSDYDEHLRSLSRALEGATGRFVRMN